MWELDYVKPSTTENIRYIKKIIVLDRVVWLYRVDNIIYDNTFTKPIMHQKFETVEAAKNYLQGMIALAYKLGEKVDEYEVDRKHIKED